MSFINSRGKDYKRVENVPPRFAPALFASIRSLVLLELVQVREGGEEIRILFFFRFSPIGDENGKFTYLDG